METFTHANGLGSDLVGAMTRDAKGDLWVATLAGLSRLHGGKIENFTTANGLSSNVVTALLARTNGTLGHWHAGSRLGCVGWPYIHSGRG
jgi:ligand-binding sensor domain-containing protein